MYVYYLIIFLLIMVMMMILLLLLLIIIIIVELAESLWLVPGAALFPSLPAAQYLPAASRSPTELE